jgi:hypothetical protein
MRLRKGSIVAWVQHTTRFSPHCSRWRESLADSAHQAITTETPDGSVRETASACGRSEHRRGFALESSFEDVPGLRNRRKSHKKRLRINHSEGAGGGEAKQRIAAHCLDTCDQTPHKGCRLVHAESVLYGDIACHRPCKLRVHLLCNNH